MSVVGISLASTSGDAAAVGIGRAARQRRSPCFRTTALMAGWLVVLAGMLAVLVAAAWTPEASGFAAVLPHGQRSCW
jgi:hypothetical protein